jgi:hypothetical protein
MVQPTRPWPTAPPHPGSSRAILETYRQKVKIQLAKSEIHKRTLNILSNLWWKYMPGTIIEVKWPIGKDSADPNHYYRPDLEKYAGKQGWHWDWRIGGVAAENQDGTKGYDTLLIKFCRSREDYAIVAKLKWM